MELDNTWKLLSTGPDTIVIGSYLFDDDQFYLYVALQKVIDILINF